MAGSQYIQCSFSCWSERKADFLAETISLHFGPWTLKVVLASLITWKILSLHFVLSPTNVCELAKLRKVQSSYKYRQAGCTKVKREWNCLPGQEIKMQCL